MIAVNSSLAPKPIASCGCDSAGDDDLFGCDIADASAVRATLLTNVVRRTPCLVV